jgi:hypothetical protein
VKTSELIASHRDDPAAAYQSLRTMTRNQLLAEARHAAREGDLLAEWLRIFADVRALGPSIQEVMFKKNWDRLERDILNPEMGKRLRAEPVSC